MRPIDFINTGSKPQEALPPLTSAEREEVERWEREIEEDERARRERKAQRKEKWRRLWDWIGKGIFVILCLWVYSLESCKPLEWERRGAKEEPANQINQMPAVENMSPELLQAHTVLMAMCFRVRKEHGVNVQYEKLVEDLSSEKILAFAERTWEMKDRGMLEEFVKVVADEFRPVYGSLPKE